MKSEENNRSFGEVFLSSVFSTTIASLINNPLSVIKITMQKNNFIHRRKSNNKLSRILPTIKFLYKENGIKRFYRGLLPNFTYHSLTVILFFGIYEKYKA